MRATTAPQSVPADAQAPHRGATTCCSYAPAAHAAVRHRGKGGEKLTGVSHRGHTQPRRHQPASVGALLNRNTATCTAVKLLQRAVAPTTRDRARIGVASERTCGTITSATPAARPADTQRRESRRTTSLASDSWPAPAARRAVRRRRAVTSWARAARRTPGRVVSRYSRRSAQGDGPPAGTAHTNRALWRCSMRSGCVSRAHEGRSDDPKACTYTLRRYVTVEGS